MNGKEFVNKHVMSDEDVVDELCDLGAFSSKHIQIDFDRETDGMYICSVSGKTNTDAYGYTRVQSLIRALYNIVNARNA